MTGQLSLLNPERAERDRILNGPRELAAKDWVFDQFDASAMRRSYLALLRRDLRTLYDRERRPVSGDDVRQIFENYPSVPSAAVLSRNFLPAVFKGGGWRCVGRIKSKVKGSHGREIKLYEAI